MNLKLRSISVIRGTSYLCVDLVLLNSLIDNDLDDGDRIQRLQNLAKRKRMKKRAQMCASRRFLLFP